VGDGFVTHAKPTTENESGNDPRLSVGAQRLTVLGMWRGLVPAISWQAMNFLAANARQLQLWKGVAHDNR